MGQEVIKVTPPVTREGKQWAYDVLSRFPRPWVITHSNNETKLWLEQNKTPFDLQCRQPEALLRYLSIADLLLTSDDTAIKAGVAVNIPMLIISRDAAGEAILGDRIDYLVISPDESGDAANRRLDAIKGIGVSAVVAIYRPEVHRLNRALECALPQVDEIIVVSDLAGKVPDGALQHPKIRYIVKNETDIGYGRKVNYAVRHTVNNLIWTLNDDCYAASDAVAKMKEVMADDVAIVGHLLLYPDGTVQHGGTKRVGDVYRHLDYRLKKGSITEPCEMENVTGASTLIRREAFYEAGAFDSDYKLYCEDTQLCIDVRQNGWKVIYTPHATAIHEEGKSTPRDAAWRETFNRSEATFKRKNADYLANGLRVKSHEPKVAIVYIHVPDCEEHEAFANRFVQSYLKHPPLVPHRTIVVCQSYDATDEMKELFSKLPNLSYYRHSDEGWDLGGFQAVSKAIDDDVMVCFGGSSYFKQEGWLARMMEVWSKHGAGLYASTASYECSPHFNTIGFWCSPKLLASYPIKCVTKEQRYDFEHGVNAFWKLAEEAGVKVLLATWDGEYGWKDWRTPKNIYRRGDQSNCICHWKQTSIYPTLSPSDKKNAEHSANTLTDKLWIRLKNKKMPLTPEQRQELEWMSEQHFKKSHNYFK